MQTVTGSLELFANGKNIVDREKQAAPFRGLGELPRARRVLRALCRRLTEHDLWRGGHRPRTSAVLCSFAAVRSVGASFMLITGTFRSADVGSQVLLLGFRATWSN